MAVGFANNAPRKKSFCRFPHSCKNKTRDVTIVVQPGCDGGCCGYCGAQCGRYSARGWFNVFELVNHEELSQNAIGRKAVEGTRRKFPLRYFLAELHSCKLH